MKSLKEQELRQMYKESPYDRRQNLNIVLTITSIDSHLINRETADLYSKIQTDDNQTNSSWFYLYAWKLETY